MVVPPTISTASARLVTNIATADLASKLLLSEGHGGDHSDTYCDNCS